MTFIMLQKNLFQIIAVLLNFHSSKKPDKLLIFDQIYAALYAFLHENCKQAIYIYTVYIYLYIHTFFFFLLTKAAFIESEINTETRVKTIILWNLIPI